MTSKRQIESRLDGLDDDESERDDDSLENYTPTAPEGQYHAPRDWTPITPRALWDDFHTAMRYNIGAGPNIENDPTVHLMDDEAALEIIEDSPTVGDDEVAEYRKQLAEQRGDDA